MSAGQRVGKRLLQPREMSRSSQSQPVGDHRDSILELLPAQQRVAGLLVPSNQHARRAPGVASAHAPSVGLGSAVGLSDGGDQPILRPEVAQHRLERDTGALSHPL